MSEQATFEFPSSHWNPVEGERLKEVGMAEAAESKKALLEHARKLAVQIAERQRIVTADDVQMALECEGISIFALGNSAGSIFLQKQWKRVGEVKSKRSHAHSNKIGQWVLRADNG